MGLEAESDLAEGDAQKESIEARNQLENFCDQSRTWRRAVLDNMNRDDKSEQDAMKNGIDLQDTHKMRRIRRARCYSPISEHHSANCRDSMSLGWGCGIDVWLYH